MSAQQVGGTGNWSFWEIVKSLCAVLRSIPRRLGDCISGFCDFAITILPRLIRGALLMIAAGGAIAFAYIALRAMWWFVCWVEDRLSI